MNKLQEIQNKCQCSILLCINRHRDYYQTIEEGIGDINRILESCGSDLLSQEIVKKMIECNTIIGLQFYPDTPVGSYSIYHYDLEMALYEALEILNNSNQD